MEDSRILDSQMTASSAYADTLSAFKGRLNHDMAWAVRLKNVYQWLQVDLLNNSQHVCAIATQGLRPYDQWVTSYSLQYSDDGVVFTDYNAGHIFQGNMNENRIVKNDLIPAIVARYIRVRPKSWNDWISMRMELYGCGA